MTYLKQPVTSIFLFNFIFLSLIFIFMQSACRRVDIEFGVSTCIREKIRTFSKYTCESGGNVMEYALKDQLVYVFSQGNCNEELNAEVVDADCNTLGFVKQSSHILANGNDFRNAQFKRIIWEDK